MNHTLYWQSVFSQRRELRQHSEARSQNCGKTTIGFVTSVNSIRDDISAVNTQLISLVINQLNAQNLVL